MTAEFLAIDWGSTNRRIFVIGSDGNVLATARDEHGVLATARDERGVLAAGMDYAAEVAAIRARFGDLPVLCAGMVGSNRGWTDAGYVAVPADLAALAAGIVWTEAGRTAIIPGVCRTAGGRADVMRGEEVQVLGAVAAGLVAGDALLCQPGTHAKWVQLAGGRITDFTTAITGEVFALLGRGSLLSDGLDLPVADGAAFRAGVVAGQGGDLLAVLFGARAALVLGQRRREDQASYVSGVLIGSDVAARMDGAAVAVLADPGLGGLYLAAIDCLGGRGTLIDSQAAFVAGISHIHRLMA